MTTVTVLGTSAAWPAPGHASSGYLLEEGDATLVLDLGYGTLARLLALADVPRIGGVFVTHSHADHAADLHGLFRAVTLSRPPFEPPGVYGPADVLDRVGPLDGPGGGERVREGLRYRSIDAGARLEIGPFRLQTFSLPHFVPNLGVRIEVGRNVIAYTGDTGPSDSLLPLARDADLFLCETTYPTPPSEPGPRLLLSASEAGRYAREAGVRRLVLTHFWPGEEREPYRRAAAREFPGPIELASEGAVLSLDSSA
ncbi:MAG TPA: MBL fold metallo-hydrolase [Thermoplasmata archaeon]|nr:MBL fold metallo-hydrolase [Thermoplasmata archaeon]